MFRTFNSKRVDYSMERHFNIYSLTFIFTNTDTRITENVTLTHCSLRNFLIVFFQRILPGKLHLRVLQGRPDEVNTARQTVQRD